MFKIKFNNIPTCKSLYLYENDSPVRERERLLYAYVARHVRKSAGGRTNKRV